MIEIQLTPFHDWLVKTRRLLHQYPELAYHELKTASMIAEILDSWRVPYRAGIAETGLVAELRAEMPGPVLALRADMDALPLEEKTDVPFRSKNPGLMHACGHDAHMTIVLGVIRSLVEHNWVKKGQGRLLFFFQPAEEGGAGAHAMIKDGVLSGERIDAIFAGHMQPELDVGNIAVAQDVSNAASDNISIRFTGRGGHGAHPHLCIDPVVVGALFVLEAQTLISRTIAPTDSAVFTIGQFHAGTARNIIPQEAILDGTLRTLRKEVREKLIDRLRKMLNGLETSHQVCAEMDIYSGYPLLVNDRRLVKYVCKVAEELLGVDFVHLAAPRMGSEDFAFFLEQVPGVLIGIGCHNPDFESKHSLHSPYFDLDERALDVGVNLFLNLLTNYGK